MTYRPKETAVMRTEKTKMLRIMMALSQSTLRNLARPYKAHIARGQGAVVGLVVVFG